MMKLGRRMLAAIVLAVATASFAAAQTAPVLSTNDKGAQCGAIYEWVDLVRELGGSKVMTGNMVLDLERRAMAPAFADDIFPVYFGKPYFSLSNGDKGKIDKAFKRCSQNGARYWYGSAGLSEAFQTRSDRYNIAAWHEEIRKHGLGSTTLAEKRVTNEIDAERQRQAEIVRTTRKTWTVNRAGDLLLDRPDFAIHGFKSHSHDFSPPCDRNLRAFNAAILIKDHAARLDPAYVEAIVANHLVPLVRSTCPEATSLVSAQFFFKGVQLDDIARRFQTSTVSTEFDFHEMPVLRATTGLDASGNLKGFTLFWFLNHRPSSDLQPYYETLTGLTHIGRQEFMSDADWADLLQARADRAERLAQAKIDAVTLAGLRLEGGGGVGLITGVEPDAYFLSHRRDLVDAVMSYSVAISKLCPGAQVPGGLTIVQYTSQEQIVDSRSGEVVRAGPEEERTFFWPRDFSDLARRVVNRTQVHLAYWLDRADGTPYYRDVSRLVEQQGCGSEPLRTYHESLRGVSNRVGGDWHDFTSIFEILAPLYQTPQ